MSEAGAPSESQVTKKPNIQYTQENISPSVIAKIAQRLNFEKKLSPEEAQRIESEVRQSSIHGATEAQRQAQEMPAVPREGETSNTAVTQENPNVALNRIGMPDTMAPETKAALSNPDLTKAMEIKEWALGVGGRRKPSTEAPVSPSAVTRPAEKVVEVPAVPAAENPATPLAKPEPLQVQEMPAVPVSETQQQTPSGEQHDPTVDPDTGLHKAVWDQPASV